MSISEIAALVVAAPFIAIAIGFKLLPVYVTVLFVWNAIKGEKPHWHGRPHNQHEYDRYLARFEAELRSRYTE
jgi:hypothetical protein